MSKTKQIVKAKNYEITNSGEAVLNEIKKVWGKIEVEREVTAWNEKKGVHFVKEDVMVDTPMKRINENYPQDMFYQFGELVEPEDNDRIVALVKKGIFDLDRAHKSFTTMDVALNKKIKPKTWSQAGEYDYPSLNTVAIYKGEEYIEDVLFAMMLKMSKRFGKRSDLDQEQIEEIVEEVCANYRSLTIADVKHIFYKMESTSSKLFNLDYQNMLQVFEDGLNAKLHHWEQRFIKDHKFNTGREKESRDRPKTAKPNGDGQDIATQLKEVEILNNNKKVKEANQKPKAKNPKQAKKQFDKLVKERDLKSK